MVDRSVIHPWVAEGRNKIRFAIVGNGLREWSQLLEFVLQAEELGFDAYWANDHPTRSMDCWTMLAALAAATKKIRLLSLVNCIYYRSPTLLARSAADVDRISNGRLILGIGVGDDVPEFEQMGIPFPPARERHALLEETIQIMYGLWDEAPFTFEGTHYRATNAGIAPKPIQKPHVPILIAGGGERVTLRQVARYADMSNFGAHEWAGGAFDRGDVERKFAALQGHCEALGRQYESILRSHYTPLLVLGKSREAVERKMENIRIPDKHLHTVPLIATSTEAIEHFQGLADAGMQYFLAVVNALDTETISLLANEVMPALSPRHTS
jgi:alkanesulfonate monooxygenase SsuD/methylene tetrahydromethanopterin reductase-like flavin-dependent oxidoreductase (luciferase family)